MNPKKLDRILAAQAAGGTLPGVVATVATDAGVVYEGACGSADIGAGRPMAIDTVLMIASMTKAITGAAAMQLVEQGKLSLDQPAGEIIPYLGSAKVLDGFDGDAQPVLRASRGVVTLRNLLTHTSGFVYEIWNANQARYLEVTGEPGLGSGLVKSLEMPLAFDPGERWEYGIGIDWAGQLVEAVTGQRLGAYMEERIFGPLGMSSTSFAPKAGNEGRAAAVHARTPDGLVPVAGVMSGPVEFDMGGGGLQSTAGDYLRFTRMMLGGGTLDGRQILRAETVAEMSRNQMGALNCNALRTVNPGLSNDCDFYPGMAQKWGLSFLINSEATPEGRSAGSLAWAGLANSYYWIDPVKRVTGVWVTQLFPFFDGEAMAAFRAFERAVYEELG